VSRAKTEFVCTVKAGKVIPDDARFNITIDIALLLRRAPRYSSSCSHTIGKVAKGRLVETIGKAGEHRVEMNAIVIEHGFKTYFPAEVEKEAESLAASHEPDNKRGAPQTSRYRELPIMTIDPATAKDFDDALSLRANPDGTLRLAYISPMRPFLPNRALYRRRGPKARYQRLPCRRHHPMLRTPSRAVLHRSMPGVDGSPSRQCLNSIRRGASWSDTLLSRLSTPKSVF